MTNNNKTVDFYMGANSPTGFCTFYSELSIPKVGYRSYLIKGGAGTGKSSLMRRVVVECGNNESLVERIHCSSDPNSLDGVILKDKKISIVDATPPHVIEPTYPGGFETVINLCEYFNEDILSKRLDKTVYYQTQNNLCHKKCCRLLSCAHTLLFDNQEFVRANTYMQKLTDFANRLAKKLLKPQQTVGIEHKRLLSAVTNQGVVAYKDTASTLADNIYLLRDEYGVSSSELLSIIRTKALSFGYEIYCCYCPLDQASRLEHLFIPSLSLGFVTHNSFVAFDLDKINPTSVISYTRFSDMDQLKTRKQLLGFNKQMAGKLIDSAVNTLKLAKEIHDKLEEQYYGGVDFESVTKKSDLVVSSICTHTDISPY